MSAGPAFNLSSYPSVAQHPEGLTALPGLFERLSTRAAADIHVEAARRSLARLLRCDAEEVIFTSGGPESSNAALKGLALAMPDARRGPIVVSAVEHPSVLHPARGLARLGFDIREVPVDCHGRVDVGEFTEALEDGAALAALQWANDEIGTIQPVEEVAARAAELGVPLHVDATAAVGWLEVDWRRVPATTLAVASDRMGGPGGVGALVVRAGQRWLPLIEGGLEEDGRRAGSVNPALVTAFGITAAAAALHLGERAVRARTLRDVLRRSCEELIDDVRVHAGPVTLPGHLHLQVPRAEGEALLAELDRAGIVAESGSACVEGAGVPSTILRACGFEPSEASSSLLFRVAAAHPDNMPMAVARALARAAKRLRALAP